MGSRTGDEIRRWLTTAIAEQLRLPTQHVDPHATFRSHGLDSSAAAALVVRLCAWLGRAVPLTALWEHPSVDELAAELGGEERPQPAEVTGRALAGEPIAIVGIACRFPGGARSPASLWALLRAGVDAIGPIPSARLDVEALARVDAATGESTAREGGFLDDVLGFDPLFFGISPREAAQMDPQQRVVLELAWEALEDAAIAPTSLVGSPTGVFVGTLWNDFALLLARAGLTAIEQHTATGLGHAIVANRVSYALGLEGPSMAVDTACSGGLVAVHLACESLQRGESTLALAGGVNLILAPDGMVQMARFGARSPTDRCRAFDADGDGYVRSEGAGLVVLEPLGRALAAGRRIYALVRGTAINNDGRSNGLSAPSPRAQRAVLAAACARAGVDPASIDYVEAHGTGTRLGDPIEAAALGAVYGPGRVRPLRIGSIKTNLGHTEAAAGIAGLIKTALVLHRRALTPCPHFRTPNPEIDFAELRLAVQTRYERWPDGDGPARAGVSAFGFGGTNAHAVLEAAPGPARQLALAADDSASLVGRAREALAALERGEPTPAPGDGRVRLAVVGRSTAGLGEGLAAYVRGESAPGLAVGVAAPRQPVFVFPGQGGQWPGMARALLSQSPPARAVLLACAREISKQAGWSLLDELLAPPHASRLRETDVVQPALFALAVALAAAWRAQGVTPRAIVGHSLGEVAAAHVAGALELADAVRVVCVRSRLARRLSGAGGALLVARPEDAVVGMLSGDPGIVVAARNSPDTTVVSGDPVALAELAAACRRDGVYCAVIDVAYAMHGPQLDPLLDELVAGLQGIVAMPAQVPMISTVTGEPIDGRALGPAYWARNLRDPVQFTTAIAGLARDGADLFLEVSPHPVLLSALRQCLAHGGHDGHALASTRRDGDDAGGLTVAAGALWTLGVPVGTLRTVGGLAGADAAVPHILPVSAHTRDALHERVAGLVALVGTARDERCAPGSIEDGGGGSEAAAIDDLCHTAALGRSHLGHRVAVVADSLAGLRERLEGVLAGGVDAHARAERPPRVALVFPGQGGAWAGMGRELLAREPVFRRAIFACDAAIGRYAGFSVADALARGEVPEDAARQQPVLFAVQVALARTWEAFGVRPVAVVGHSMGEVAAAHVAGALDLDDAARLIACRSRHIAGLAGRGTMAIVDAAPTEVDRALGRHPGRASVAARNSARSVLLAGEVDAIEEIAGELQAMGEFARLTGLPFPMHCPQSRPLAPALARDLAGLSPRPGALPIYSTLLGQTVDGTAMDAEYWVRHALEPVQFHEQTRALLRDGVDVLLEVGPHPVLAHACEQTIAEVGAPALVLGSLRRGTGRAHLLEGLAKLYGHGLDVEWSAILRGGRVESLPAYPFQRWRPWPAALAGGEPTDREPARAAAPARPELAALAEALRTGPLNAALVERYLQHQAGELLALSPAALSPASSLRRLGLDSLMAIRLGNRVREVLRVDSPATLFLADQSLAALARALVELAAQGRAAAPSADAVAAGMEEGEL